jgi:SAM-dependent methyltransferase
MQRIRIPALRSGEPAALAGLRARSDELFPVDGFVQRIQWAITHAMLEPSPKDQMLEITCAGDTAYQKLAVKGNYPNTITFGGDLDSMGDLPLPDGMFDKAVILYTVEHSADPQAFLREVARVLKPGGRVVFQVPSLSYREASSEVREDYQTTTGARDLYNRVSLEKRLRDAGLRITDWVYVFNSPLSHRLFTWAMHRDMRGIRYAILSPLAHRICILSDRMWGRPNEGHFLIVQAVAAPPDPAPSARRTLAL